jgi:hypothetical protein
MPNESVNYWKFATIGIVLAAATVAATLLVIGRDSKTEPPHLPTETSVQGTEGKAASAPIPAGVAPANRQHSARVGNSSSALPPKSVMEACNEYANDHVNSKTEEVLRDAALGAAIGGVTGAAGGGPFTDLTKPSHTMRNIRQHTLLACGQRITRELLAPVEY